MSTSLAIAAVTATLRNLLALGIGPDADLADTIFTSQPPDQARSGSATANQLNLFLYRVTRNAAWTNTDLPDRVRAGETGTPPLPLNLSYLLTAYGRDNDQQRPFSHVLLGRAMSLLHDHPILSAEEIRRSLPESEIDSQIERVRLTLEPLTLDEITKLWSGFQTQYRLSASYEAAVVLIEGTRPVRAPLPVLQRSFGDRGVIVQANMKSPFPVLTAIHPALPSTIDTAVTLEGINLGGERVNLRLEHDDRSWELPAEPGGNQERVSFVLPHTAGLIAGAYAARVVIDGTHASNALSLAIGPRITSPLPVQVRRAGGEAVIELEFLPAIEPRQRAFLLLGDREVPAAPRRENTTRLRFVVTEPTLGNHVLRLRVNGIDTPIVADPNARVPAFDPRAVIRIEP